MVVSGLTSAAPREDGERLSGRPRENEEPLASALSGCPFHPQTRNFPTLGNFGN